MKGSNEVYNHFTDGFGFYRLFWVFLIGCVLGVVVETLWCLLTRHRFESRVGLIYGPLNPVYGVGALALAVGLHPVRDSRDIVICIAGAILGSIVEYVCSWVQEKSFGSVSWDYSKMFFNLHGRINLLYSIFWGGLAIFWVKDIYPRMIRWISHIPNKIGIPLTWVLLVFVVVDIAVSACAVYRWKQRIEKIEPQTQFEYFMDEHYPDERMQKIYPNMKFKNADVQQ